MKETTKFIDHTKLRREEFKSVSLTQDKLIDYNNILCNEEQFSVEEEKAYQFILNVFVPKVTKYLEKSNPVKFNEWKGNCCRQVAMFSAAILEFLLPDYEWKVYDCTLQNKEYSMVFNHAYTMGQKKESPNTFLLVDLERAPLSKNVIFKLDNPDLPYPHGYFKEYSNEELIKVTDILDTDTFRKYNKTLKEFYSAKTGYKIIKDILYELKISYSKNKENVNYINKILFEIDKL